MVYGKCQAHARTHVCTHRHADDLEQHLLRVLVLNEVVGIRCKCRTVVGVNADGLCSHGLGSYGPCSYGLCKYGLRRYSLCSYGRRR